MDDEVCCGTGGIQAGAAWLVVAVFSVVILKNLSFIFIPLSVAVLVLFALGIPIDFLKRFKIPSWLRILIVVLSVLIFLYLVGRLVQSNVEQFVHKLPLLEKKLWEYGGMLVGHFGMTVSEAKETVAAFTSSSLSGVGIEPLGTVLKQVGGSFFQFLGNMLWVLLFLVFILAERETFGRRLEAAFGQQQAGVALEVWGRISRAIEHYLGLKTLLSLLTGVLAALALWLFGVEFALLWGVLTFLLNFIPNIGSLIATVPPVAVALFQSGSVGRALIVAGVLTIIQMAVGNFLEPKVMGRGLNLSPLVVLLSLIFWGWLWGIVGMLLAVPLTAAVKTAFEQYGPTKAMARLLSAA